MKRETVSTEALSRILAIVLLPLMLASFGGWEVVRGNATAAERAQDHLRLTAELGRLRTLARTDPQATVSFRGEAQSYAAPSPA